MSIEIPINPQENFTFQQLYMCDVYRLKLPDIGSGPNRAAFFYKDGQVFAAGQTGESEPIWSTRQPDNLQPWPTHAGPISVKSVVEYLTHKTYMEDTPLSVKEISNRVGWTVNCHFGALPAPDPPARLLLDTGDDTTWIYGVDVQEGELTRDELVSETTGPLPEDSPLRPSRAYRADGREPYSQENFSIRYRDGGRVSGKTYRDDFIFLYRGSPKGKVTLTFGVATLANKAILEHKRTHGVLGLGYSKAGVISGDTIVEPFTREVTEQYGLERLVFSLKFHTTPPNILAFGPPLNPLPFRRWEYVNVSRQFWDVPFSEIGVVIGGRWEIFNLDEGTSNTAHIDCGSSLCYIRQDKLEQLYARVGGVLLRGIWTIPKNIPVPDIGLKLGRSWLQLPGSFLRYRHLNSEYDHAAIQPSTPGYSVLGGAFFRHVDVYFDPDDAEPRIGFDDRMG